MHKLAVIGNPIEHSLSPLVFNNFAFQFNLSLEYTKILASDNLNFKLMVDQFFNAGGMALNITSPFKQAAYNFTNLHTMRSQFCQAGNFMRKTRSGELILDTTDGIGLVIDIQNHKRISLANKNILILGSGFVLESILLDIIVENPARIDILARNLTRVNGLKAKFGVGDYQVQQMYDIILNVIPKNVANDLFKYINSLPDGTLCYDLSYAQDETPFLSHMRAINPTVILSNGLGMLIEQAQVAFNVLFAKAPDTSKTLADFKSMGY